MVYATKRQHSYFYHLLLFCLPAGYSGILFYTTPSILMNGTLYSGVV